MKLVAIVMLGLANVVLLLTTWAGGIHPAPAILIAAAIPHAAAMVVLFRARGG